MGEIHFRFSNEKQRQLNLGKKVDKQENIQRHNGRHQRTVKINVNMRQIRRISYPDAVEVCAHALKDVYGNVIVPSNPEYWTKKPITVTFICSEVNPFPLARANEYDLDDWIHETFDNLVTDWNVTEKEEPAMKQILFTHRGALQANEETRLGNVNKNAFNVSLKEVNEHEIDVMNEKLSILGYKLNKNDAILRSQRTINTPSKLSFEVGDF